MSSSDSTTAVVPRTKCTRKLSARHLRIVVDEPDGQPSPKDSSSSTDEEAWWVYRLPPPGHLGAHAVPIPCSSQKSHAPKLDGHEDGGNQDEMLPKVPLTQSRDAFTVVADMHEHALAATTTSSSSAAAAKTETNKNPVIDEFYHGVWTTLPSNRSTSCGSSNLENAMDGTSLDKCLPFSRHDSLISPHENKHSFTNPRPSAASAFLSISPPTAKRSRSEPAHHHHCHPTTKRDRKEDVDIEATR
jgi:hypothetical protein